MTLSRNDKQTAPAQSPHDDAVTTSQTGLIAFVERHSGIQIAAVAAGVFGVAALILWFVVFSGLSVAADMLYSNF